jgi:MFS transporter, YNFM family, putative membrane transport protein
MSFSSNRFVWLLALASFASTSAVRVLDPALPELAREFSITTGQAADVVTLFAVAYGVMLFFYGPIGDRFGKYKTLSIATFACAFSSLIVAWSPTFEWLIGARVLSAITGAAIVPLAMAWIGDHVSYEQRQATLAQFTIGSILGITTGQVIGGVFTATLGWRGAFYFLAVLYVLVGALLWSQRSGANEVAGRSVSLTQLYVPVLTVLRVRWARIVLLTVLFEGALVFGVLSYVPTFLQKTHGINAALAGIIASLFAVGAFFYVFLARWFIARLGETGMVRAGGVVLALSYVTYLYAPGWGWAMLASALTGLGYYFIHAVLQTHATQMASTLRGTAVSLSSSCLMLGQAGGVALGSLVADGFGIGTVLLGATLFVPLLAFWFTHEIEQLRAMRQQGLS